MSARTVLVINDDECMRDVLRAALEIDGYAVVTAADGAEALALLETTHPALILADAVMPVMNGAAFLAAYRAAPAPHAPVIATSAGVLPQQVALAALADDVLALPFDLDELLALVERHAQHARTGRN